MLNDFSLDMSQGTPWLSLRWSWDEEELDGFHKPGDWMEGLGRQVKVGDRQG